MKKINLNDILWFLILLIFTIYLGYLVYTGNISIFIHPKMQKFVIFTLVVFFMLSIIQFKRAITISNHNHKFKVSALIFFLPLILGLVINPQKLNAEMINKKGLSEMKEHTHAHEFLNDDEGLKFMEICNLLYEKNNTDLNGHVHKQNFESADNLEVSITGFVYREKESSADRIILSRLVMTCCAADTQFMGVVCEVPKGLNLENNQWIRIKGKVVEDKNSDKKFIIKADNVEIIEEPNNQYIYP